MKKIKTIEERWHFERLWDQTTKELCQSKLGEKVRMNAVNDQDSAKIGEQIGDKDQ